MYIPHVSYKPFVGILGHFAMHGSSVAWGALPARESTAKLGTGLKIWSLHFVYDADHVLISI